VVELELPAKQSVNQFVVQEDIQNGERIRKYEIQAYLENGWLTIGKGECVGHKRIQIVEPVETDRIRLLIQDSTASPQIKNLSAYFVNIP
jgi:alpha-L-fucosidase